MLFRDRAVVSPRSLDRISGSFHRLTQSETSVEVEHAQVTIPRSFAFFRVGAPDAGAIPARPFSVNSTDSGDARLRHPAGCARPTSSPTGLPSRFSRRPSCGGHSLTKA